MKTLNTTRTTWPSWRWLHQPREVTQHNSLLRRIVCHLAHGRSHKLRQLGYGGIYQVVCTNCACSWVTQR